MGILDIFKKKENVQAEYTNIGQKGQEITHNVGALSFYTGLADRFFAHDDLPSSPLGNGDFYYTAEAIFTSNGVKKPLIITSLPEELPRGFISDLRLMVDDYITSYRLKTGTSASVSINLIQDLVHYNLNLDSVRSRGRWVGFARMYEKVLDQMEEKTLEDELKADKHSEAVRRKVKSFLHIKMARDEYRAAFYKTALFLEIHVQADNVYEQNDTLKEAERAINSFCLQNRIKTKRLFLDAHNYYNNYAPTSSFNDSTLMRRKFTGNVYSDDTLSSFTVPEHGKVGDETGVYHGIDVRSREVVAFDLAKGSDAKNILVTAATGEGKSRAMKTILSFYAIDPKYQSVIFDYEGTEYSALGTVTDATTVGIGSTQGSYVNTMVITKPTGDPATDRGRLNQAKEMTERVFDLLFDADDGMDPEMRAIFSYILNAVYVDAGVNEEQPELWYERTQHLTFFTIYQKLKDLIDNKNDEQFLKEHNPHDIRRFHNVIMVYFSKGQLRNHWFQEPIDINAFLESKDVIFNFDMGGQGEDSVDEQQLSLRQMFASHLTTLKSMYNKQRGVRTVVVVEEMQRYIKHKYSRQIVSQFVSGGRKNGLVVYLVTNAPQELLLTGSMSSPLVKDEIGAILSNINIYIIGALNRGSMQGLISEYGLWDSEGYLNQLVDIKENERKNAPLKHCFYIKYKDQKTIVKFIVHPAFDKSPLYYAAPSEYNKNLMRAESIDRQTLTGQIDDVSEQNKLTKDMNYREKVEKVWL